LSQVKEENVEVEKKDEAGLPFLDEYRITL
jgi:hypothetical protein